MLEKLGQIVAYSLIAFFIAVFSYPIYINFLKKLKALKTIRETTADWKDATIFKKLHSHKAWTPTAWGGLILIIVFVMVLGSVILQKAWVVQNSLISQQETYILLFALFWMGFIGLFDDFVNVLGITKVRWISMKMKVAAIVWFSCFTAFWFTYKLWAHNINLWPLPIDLNLHIVDLDLNKYWLGFLVPLLWTWVVAISLYPIVVFFMDLMIVNAVNITDWLDGLVGWMLMFVFIVCWVITFYYGWYLATTLIWIVICTLAAFLWFNIHPAKVFLGDSWALGLWGFLAAILYLINLKAGFFIPFFILFSIFIIEVSSSFFQLFWKKHFKKKLFTIAPFHHLLEYRWLPEQNIVMRFWLIQMFLAIVTLVIFFYQYNSYFAHSSYGSLHDQTIQKATQLQIK